MEVGGDPFATLPVEFHAASEALPLTCRRLRDIFKSASPTTHADYLIARYLAAIITTTTTPYSIVTYALRFPLCTPTVLDAVLARPHCPPILPDQPELPRRLFRHLSATGAEAFPLLRFLYASPQLRTRPYVDSHDGYPLARAVLAGAVPLVRFLLDHGASPRRKDAIAVRFAIKRRDLALVRLLVEPPEVTPGERRRGKRRRLTDRVQVSSEMLSLAVRCGARDIAEYLMNEKGCVPDLRTLSLLSIANF
ncbi:hypothetical protein BJV78DRAFT_1181133 [Lactifluus subvellereus]|nr:hypothetical protein BJV78DRAFT_1181133 [Lactifluus subvellereus]